MDWRPNVHQTPKTKYPNRADHIWTRKSADEYKCVLCGAITFQRVPPNHPTDPEWVPLRYEKLTDDEKLLCPFVLGKDEGGSYG